MNRIERKVEAATVAASEGSAATRIEIVSERRRSHDAEFRARIVAASLVPGTNIKELARRHGLCSSIVYRWRRTDIPRAGAASAVRLVPVQIADPRKVQGPASLKPPPHQEATGRIEIELENGVRVHVDAHVTTTTLRRVIAALRG